MSDAENFVARWSRLKRDTAKETKDKTAADAAAPQAWRSRRRAGSGGRAACGGRVDGACLRSGEPAVNRVHYGQQRHPRLSAKGCAGGIDQGSVAPRLDHRSRNSRFYRHRREPVGLHRSNRHARFRSARSHRQRSRARCPGYGETRAGTRSDCRGNRSVRSRYRFHICCGQRSVSRGALASIWHASRKRAGGARRGRREFNKSANQLS